MTQSRLENLDHIILDFCETGLVEPAKILYDEIILYVLELWKRVLKKQRMLLDLPPRSTLVIGDIHGDYQQVLRAFTLFDRSEIGQIVFNGDVIDRGEDMLKCILYIMIRQIREPKKVFFIRGNHETQSINEFYGFKSDCISIFSEEVYSGFNKAFELLPLSAKLGDWAFITHGGIPVDPIYFHMMRLEPKPADPLLHHSYGELLWNDPRDELTTYSKSMRGENIYYFGEKIVNNFMELHKIDLIVRAHEAYEKGYAWHFDKKVLTIFSSKVGPYVDVDPHFALLKNNEVSLIRSLDIEIELFIY